MAASLSVTPYHITLSLSHDKCFPRESLEVTLITLRELCGEIDDSTVGLLIEFTVYDGYYRSQLQICYHIFSPITRSDPLNLTFSSAILLKAPDG